MKLTILLFLATLLQANATVTAQKITIHEKNTPLSSVLEIIKKETGYVFLCNNFDPAKEVVTVNVRNVYLVEALDACLKKANINYSIIDRTILLSKKQVVEKPKPVSISVHGIVRDEKSLPVEGASVMIQGKNLGVLTDSVGSFNITLDPGAVLVIAYTGYFTKYVEVHDRRPINITLNPKPSSLSDIVVVGYGKQEKVSLTDAVSSIDNQEIVTTKNENILNMLTGKIAGLRIVQNSSAPGSFDNSIDIRGMGSPLVIIDGVPRDNITRLDPNDVESISVLKDAGASVYGVRAANGVILVTTKRGKKGALKLNYSGNITWQKPSGLPQTVGAIDYMTLFNEKTMHNVNGGTISFKDEDFEAYRNGTKKSTDWYSSVFKNAYPQSQHNLSASGGSDKTTYYLSLGYTTQDGIYQSGDLNYQRYNVRSNVTSKMTKRITLDLNINAIMDETTAPYADAFNIIKAYWRKNPLDPAYANNNPDYLSNPAPHGINPIALASKDISGYQNSTNRWFQSSISLTYKMPGIEGLDLKGLYSYDYKTIDRKSFRKKYYQYNYDASRDFYEPVAVQSPSSVSRAYYSMPNTLSQLSATYEHQFGGAHNMSALLLYEHSKRVSDNFNASRELALDVDQLLAGNSLNQIGSMDAGALFENANSGLVGRIEYDYKKKYLAKFSFRKDISSKFPVDHQSGFFPSASLGWRLSEENFWKNSSALKFINSFKLRVDYGKLGDDNASSYQFVTGYTYPASGSNNTLPPGSVFGGTFVNSLQSKGLPNPNIFWFVAKTLDIGVDAEAWNGLFGFSVDYFKRDRSGLLATRDLSLPSVVGANLPQENLNSDRTQGIDVELNHRNHLGDFNYFVKGIFSFTRTENIYIERSKAGNSYDNWRNRSNNRYTGKLWGYGGNGQFQNYEDILNNPYYVSRNVVVGDYTYEDYNGDGMISDLDVHPIAYDGIPLINYGLTIGGSYKGFDVNLLFQGASLVDYTYIEQLREPLWFNSGALVQFMDRWHPTDPTADPYDPNTAWTPGRFAYTGTLPFENSTFNVQNASYLRLKSIDLGYTLPARVVSAMGIKSARIYVNGYNVLTITKLKYVDPEHPESLWGYQYPLNKTYSVGINIQF